MAADNQTTALAIRHLPYQGMTDLVQAGALLARSGFIGIKNEADGFVIATACHQTGMTFMEFSETYHIVEGKPSMRADAMLARLMELGGEYEIVERSDTKAAIKATFGKATGMFSLSWEEAQQEPFPWCDAKHTTFKKNWATPRARKQMLWARAVSDAVRTVCPQACKGTYTPEEVQDFADPDRDAIPTQGRTVDVSEVVLPDDVQQAPKPQPQDIVVPNQNPSAPVPPNEDPFRKAKQASVVQVDVSLCPVDVGGGELGKPWSLFDMEILNYIVDNAATMQAKFPAITAGHITHIQTVIASLRGTAQ